MAEVGALIVLGRVFSREVGSKVLQLKATFYLLSHI